MYKSKNALRSIVLKIDFTMLGLKTVILIILLGLMCTGLSAELLIPMDRTQTNHLKAYGVAFAGLKEQMVVKWLLNYRGGSFQIGRASCRERV